MSESEYENRVSERARTRRILSQKAIQHHGDCITHLNTLDITQISKPFLFITVQSYGIWIQFLIPHLEKEW